MSRVPNASMYTERIKLRPKLYNPNSVARLSCMTMMDTQERIHEAHMRGYTMRGTLHRRGYTRYTHRRGYRGAQERIQIYRGAQD